MRIRYLAATLVAALLLASAAAQGLPREARRNILDAIVQIVPYDTDKGELLPWSGSGSIISPSGYILTNYHVIGELNRRVYYDWSLIYVTGSEFVDQPPEPMFWAQYVAGDPTHDLAILKIVEWLDEEPVGDMRFPHVTVGDSNALLPGDYITIVGYPGISGSTITFTAGLMSGWLGEDMESGGRQWIKTDGKIAHGNSGGGAFDETGALIGVPTAGRTVQYEQLDVEDQAYVRPISLAWALIGPHVPDVARTSGSSAPTTANSGGSTQPTTPPATQQQPATQAVTASTTGCEFCYIGNIGIGQVATHTIVGKAEGINYHTYGVVIPEGTQQVTIDLKADFDVDIAIKFGADVTSWADDGDWDYRNVTEEYGGAFAITNPRPGIWYVDVIYYYEEGSANYQLNIR